VDARKQSKRTIGQRLAIQGGHPRCKKEWEGVETLLLYFQCPCTWGSGVQTALQSRQEQKEQFPLRCSNDQKTRVATSYSHAKHFMARRTRLWGGGGEEGRGLKILGNWKAVHVRLDAAQSGAPLHSYCHPHGWSRDPGWPRNQAQAPSEPEAEQLVPPRPGRCTLRTADVALLPIT
jgi:hypothetical protein